LRVFYFVIFILLRKFAAREKMCFTVQIVHPFMYILNSYTVSLFTLLSLTFSVEALRFEVPKMLEIEGVEDV